MLMNGMTQTMNVHTEGPVPARNTNWNISGNELQYDSACTSQSPLSEVPDESQILWTDIIKKGTKKNQAAGNVETNQTIGNTPPRQNWKHQLHLLHGTAGKGSQGPTFSADIDIVAYNVAKHITSVDLSNCLAENGLNVKDCKLLTTAEDARSLSYKVTISSGDYERATKDVSVWPYRVGVRLFKHFSNAKKTNQNMDHNKARKGNNTRAQYGKQRGETQRINMGTHTVSSRGNTGNVNPTVLSRGNTGTFGNGFNMGLYGNDERSVWLRPESQN